MPTRLDELTNRVCTLHKAVQDAGLTALGHALDAGDALLEILDRKLVRHGQKSELFRRTCSSARTGREYVMLARHRTLIEQIGRTSADLSIAAALKMIRQAKGTSRTKTKSNRTGIAMTNLTDEQLTEALTAIGFDRFNKVMPRDWVPQLERRLADQVLSRLQQKRVPQRQIQKVRLRLVGGTDQHATH
jgi:hypothetical protein